MFGINLGSPNFGGTCLILYSTFILGNVSLLSLSDSASSPIPIPPRPVCPIRACCSSSGFSFLHFYNGSRFPIGLVWGLRLFFFTWFWLLAAYLIKFLMITSAFFFFNYWLAFLFICNFCFSIPFIIAVVTPFMFKSSKVLWTSFSS